LLDEAFRRERRAHIDPPYPRRLKSGKGMEMHGHSPGMLLRFAPFIGLTAFLDCRRSLLQRKAILPSLTKH